MDSVANTGILILRLLGFFWIGMFFYASPAIAWCERVVSYISIQGKLCFGWYLDDNVFVGSYVDE